MTSLHGIELMEFFVRKITKAKIIALSKYTHFHCPILIREVSIIEPPYNCLNVNEVMLHPNFLYVKKISQTFFSSIKLVNFITYYSYSDLIQAPAKASRLETALSKGKPEAL